MKSVYIHIPFCKKICSYCDFCKFYYDKKWIKEYLNALENEIKNNYNGEEIKTIYIGGGTPSCLEIDELEKLFEIIKMLKIEKLEEFTIECNVEDINEEKLILLKNNKVNRLSIGVQTFNKEILKNINRNAVIDPAKQIILAKKYFDNINVDLMYAFSNETIADLEKDLKEFIKLDVKHISCYSLILEEHTKFYNENVQPIDEDLDFEMYEVINDTLEKNGYIHYEVSNYSKRGYESKHNLVYWNNEEYYGFGVGAAGYIGNERYTNTKNILNYNRGINKKEIEQLQKTDKMKYEIILGLRKMKGISKKDFYKKYNLDIYDVFDLKDLILKEYIYDDKDYIYINKKYIYLSNEILLNFV